MSQFKENSTDCSFLSEKATTNMPEMGATSFLSNQLQLQYGILTPELLPFVASHLELPKVATQVPFNQILDYRRLLEAAMYRQNKFLEDTGVKLEAYYSTFPSGEHFGDQAFDEQLFAALFGEDLYEPTHKDTSTPASSRLSSMASPAQTFGSGALSPASRGIKRIGKDFRGVQVPPKQKKSSFSGYQKNYSGRTIFPIREISEDLSSPLGVKHPKAELAFLASDKPEDLAEDFGCKSNDGKIGLSVSVGPDTPESSQNLGKKAGGFVSAKHSTATKPRFESNESLALELRKQFDRGTTPEPQNPCQLATVMEKCSDPQSMSSLGSSDKAKNNASPDPQVLPTTQSEPPVFKLAPTQPPAITEINTIDPERKPSQQQQKIPSATKPTSGRSPKVHSLQHLLRPVQSLLSGSPRQKLEIIDQKSSGLLPVKGTSGANRPAAISLRELREEVPVMLFGHKQSDGLLKGLFQGTRKL